MHNRFISLIKRDYEIEKSTPNGLEKHPKPNYEESSSYTNFGFTIHTDDRINKMPHKKMSSKLIIEKDNHWLQKCQEKMVQLSVLDWKVL